MLILGSLPGEASLAAGHYYAHPRNAFWPIVSQLLGIDLLALDWPVRYTALQKHGIALWDVVGRAERAGSLDAALRNVAANPLGQLVATLPELRCVAFNGGTAARIGQRQLLDHPVAKLALPSTSPAHTLPFASKFASWSALSDYLR